jgi:hypothetical protein
LQVPIGVLSGYAALRSGARFFRSDDFERSARVVEIPPDAIGRLRAVMTEACPFRSDRVRAWTELP